MREKLRRFLVFVSVFGVKGNFCVIFILEVVVLILFERFIIF